MMRALGVSLKLPVNGETPFQTCLRWHHEPLIRYFLSLKLYTVDELNDMFQGLENKHLVSLIRQYYPTALPEKSNSRWLFFFSDF